jgi:hypothetical protein
VVLYFNPLDVDDICIKMKRTLLDKNLQDILVNKVRDILKKVYLKTSSESHIE